MRILVVDDELLYQRLIQVNLEAEGYDVVCTNQGEKALEIANANRPDLIILDVMMPGIDGFTVLERIRQLSTAPVIMLTAKSDESSRVRGLNLGADDYIVKPFSATEMVARVRAVLRRTHGSENEKTNQRFFVHTNLKIDLARAEVFKDDKPIYLSATEYRLLIQFAQNSGKILTAEDLLGAVWGEQYREDKEILWVSIARLRQKLEDDPHSPQHIVTRSGLGYYMPPSEV